jgi:hypothetical protein
MVDADLISRKEAVSRISDLIVLELRCKRIPTWNEVYQALNELPTVDAAPIVRCEDCKHLKSVMCPLNMADGYYVPASGTAWFCADGERRESDEISS